MTTHLTEDDIVRITRGLVDRSLPKTEWTHAGHFAAAFGLIADPDIDAAAEMPGLIRAYNLATGVENTDASGYHETITLASLRAARAWLAARPDIGLAEALGGLLVSPYGRPDWLLVHWSRPRLFSVEARRRWTPPDLTPLPF